MKEKRNLLQRLAEGVDLPGEPLPGQPIAEIAGDRRVLIENHHGVKEYTREKICINVKFGQLSVCGCGLELSLMTREQLVISGRIDSITLHRREKA